MGRGEQRLLRQRVEDERWKPPDPIEIKINFDGAFDKQNSRSRIGIVCRDLSGKILNCRVMVNNRVPTPFVVEALSCLQAMKAGLNLGFRRVVVEGDALNIIKKVKSNDKDKSILSQYISDIK
ncbi:hypothetical protein Goarm_003690, partial [Gossypium armourianum]|nr:hypothetical protein [Gossypium armourianum]